MIPKLHQLPIIIMRDIDHVYVSQFHNCTFGPLFVAILFLREEYFGSMLYLSVQFWCCAALLFSHWGQRLDQIFLFFFYSHVFSIDIFYGHFYHIGNIWNHYIAEALDQASSLNTEVGIPIKIYKYYISIVFIYISILYSINT